MKYLKKILVIFIFFMFVPTINALEDNENSEKLNKENIDNNILEISLSFNINVGEAINYISLDDNRYSIINQTWYNLTDDKTMDTNDDFESNKEYRYNLVLNTNSTYEFGEDLNFNIASPYYRNMEDNKTSTSIELTVNFKMAKQGWILEGGNTYYYDNDELFKGVHQIENNYYYFNEEGILQKNYIDGIYYYNEEGIRVSDYLLSTNEGIYYFGLNGKKVRNFWLDYNKDGKVDYYFNNDYKAVNGVQSIKGINYYFKNYKKQYGVMYKNYFYGIKDGIRVVNYLWNSGNGYYYFGQNGKKFKNKWLDYNKDKKYDYYFDETGKSVNGINKIDNTYYYFKNYKKQYGKTDGIYFYDKKSGKRKRNYFWITETGTYYFGQDKKMSKGIIYTNNEPYLFKKDGRLALKWQIIKNTIFIVMELELEVKYL